MKKLSKGTILKTEDRYFEISKIIDSGYKICEVEGDFEMGLDEKVIIKGLKDGSWEIIE
ncbi:hypothetical protein [Pedobacter aquatilis]|uniref:hypothetical protein n=1 Tax=Pedobacter aquatilis TaxID=351343 RepID=UPI002930D67B|nr:hypothetical protein [Pedobacter aquatilis]